MLKKLRNNTSLSSFWSGLTRLNFFLLDSQSWYRNEVDAVLSHYSQALCVSLILERLDNVNTRIVNDGAVL